MDNKKLLGKRIKELRKNRNLTQEKLAEMIDIETCSLSAIESGRYYPAFPTIEKIASSLNYDLNIFFDYKHLKTKEEKIKEIQTQISSQPEEIINIVYRIIH